jgi:acylglycerol lipase
MPHIESSWKTPDGLTIFFQEWQPETEAKAVIILIHGLGEHSNRYAHVAKMANDSGYSFIAMDLRGHGRSEGIRGYFPSFDVVLDDMDHLLGEAQKIGKPVFFYGHSLGGNLVLYYGLTRKSDVAGVIATAPAFAPGSPVSPIKLGIGKLLYNLAPTLTLANGLDLHYLSHDPEVMKNYLADPLIHNKISARMGIDLIKNGPWLINHAHEFSYPLLLMQGGEDRIANPAATRAFARNVNGKATLLYYDKLYHELHNEIEKEKIISTILSWVSGRLTVK